tara:strand:+ start:959 stop:1546 length:588 start_codon:yes stop_codon:yes gene_type:complete
MLKQLGLFEDLEMSVEETPKLNIKRNYGMLMEDLNMFSYWELMRIYFGYHNISLPHEMMLSSDSPEILVIMQAAAMVKKKHGLFQILKNMPIEDIVSGMNDIIYGKSAGAGIYKRAGHTPHLDRRISQRKRLLSLDREVKEAFLRSFRRDYVCSFEEGSTGRFEDVGTKSNYKKSIFKFIKEMYRENTQKNNILI